MINLIKNKLELTSIPNIKIILNILQIHPEFNICKKNQPKLVNLLNLCETDLNKELIIDYSCKLVSELKNICKNEYPHLPSNQKKESLVKMMINPTEYIKPITTNRANNGKIEDIRLDHLILSFKNYLDNNKPIPNWNLPIQPQDIERFDKKGGTSTHDIDIILKNKDICTIEVKGITSKKKITDDLIKTLQKHPWKLTPQLVNAPYNFSCTDIACKLWYDKYIPQLQELYPDLPQITSFEKWTSDDASMGSATTEFGTQLKDLYNNKTKKTPKCKKIIQDLVNNWLYDFWKMIDDSDELKYKLQMDIEQKMQKSLRNKTYWLNVIYENESIIKPDNFIFSITPKVILIKTMDIKLNEKSSLAKMTYYLLDKKEDLDNGELHNNELFEGEARLRFRNGAGIANIGWGLK